MSAKAAAQALIGNIHSMSVADVSKFVKDGDKAMKFLEEFQGHVDRFNELVSAQAEIDNIERLLLQAKHDRDTAGGELTAARETAQTIVNEASAERKTASKDAQIVLDAAAATDKKATLEAGRFKRRLIAIEKDASDDRKRAADELRVVETDREAASNIREVLAGKKAEAERLIAALDN